ncbi:DsrE family protein [Anaeromonas frigoriresistens]|nr:DsrE family protein [Anaeromonas frigoriresistens]
MYVLNSKIRNWWKDITLIIWGLYSKLLSEGKNLQDHIFKKMEIGVEIVACRACADSYRATDKLENLNIEVKYMGELLTKYLKEGYKTITF